MSEIAVMRNRVSTEFRKVGRGSDEYLELQAQRDPNDGKPVWEETSLPNAIEQSKRLESGDVRPEDIGDGQGAAGRIGGGVPVVVPSSAVPERLPSEREAGIDDPIETTSMPPREEIATEVPLTAVMESSTDTELGGTEPDLEDTPRPNTGEESSGGKRSSRSKKSSAKDSTKAEDKFDEEQQSS